MFPEEFTIKLRPRSLLIGVALSPVIVLLGWWVCSWDWESNNAPAWVQAVGSVLAIIAAWFVPQLHEAAKERRKRDQMLRNLGWMAIRTRVMGRRLIEVLDFPDANLSGWIGLNDLERWNVQRQAVDTFPIETLAGDDVVIIANLRLAAVFGQMVAESICEQARAYSDVVDDTVLLRRRAYEACDCCDFVLDLINWTPRPSDLDDEDGVEEELDSSEELAQ